MAAKGLFITLGDKASLQLYLNRGIYSQRMRDYRQKNNRGESLSAHYGTLADFGTVRPGDYVFFFRQRRIYFGGRVTGTGNDATFAFNGPFSPLVDAAPLVWDESGRDQYDALGEPGVFDPGGEPYDDGEPKRYCHPYLIRFETDDRTGEYVSSDALYWELGEYRYPLMSNSIANRGFTELTPGETTALLRVLEDPDGRMDLSETPDVSLDGEAREFRSEISIDGVSDANSENQLEAAVLANPDILPEPLQPGDETAVLRQVPMTPYKPYGSQSDRADVCYYDMTEPLADGTLPNTLIELKQGKAGGPAARQAAKYRRWLGSLLSEEDLDRVDVVVFAPKFYLPNFTNSEYAGDQLDSIMAWRFGDTGPLNGVGDQVDIDEFR